MSEIEKIKASGIFDFPVFPVPDSKIPPLNGEGKQGLLVVLGESASPELKAFLGKIMGAVGLDLSKDAFVFEVQNGEKFAFAKKIEEQTLQQVILFGVAPGQALLNINAPLYHPFKMSGTSLLFGDQLSAIQADNNLKKLLWGCLKNMFQT